MCSSLFANFTVCNTLAAILLCLRMSVSSKARFMGQLQTVLYANIELHSPSPLQAPAGVYLHFAASQNCVCGLRCQSCCEAVALCGHYALSLTAGHALARMFTCIVVTDNFCRMSSRLARVLDDVLLTVDAGTRRLALVPHF